MAKNIVLISGGPGLFNTKDIEHDKSWANYVTPPILKWDSGKSKLTGKGNEALDVHWLVYKPAYEERWTDDDGKNRSSADETRKKGFSSYVDMIEGRAKERGWILHWFDSATNLWQRLWTFMEDIVRLWFWGHARDSLWFSLGHDDSTAVMPSGDAVLKVSDITDPKNKLRATIPDDPATPTCRFVGCNTEAFATAWAKTYSARSEGVRGKIEFSEIHKTGGDPALVKDAQIVIVDGTGATNGQTKWASLDTDATDDGTETEVAVDDDSRLDTTTYGGGAIVIDAGHGGTRARGGATPDGVVGRGGTRERTVTLAIAKMLAARLGRRAILTRTDHKALSLAERARVAREAGASVFVSIHANGGAPGDHGPETWVHSAAGPRSHALAKAIQGRLERLSGDGRGVLAAPLGVLTPEHHAPWTAACLVEMDFLSHPEGERRLTTPHEQAAIADALAAAIRAYVTQ